MGKRRPTLRLDQLAFDFATPPVPALPGDLKLLGPTIASGVGRMLNEDQRSREAISEAMALLLAEPVSRAMLDAYASEARDSHNISAARLLALTAVTGRFDILDAVILQI